ncbi:hypothetical protein DRJ17_04900 [Candidatus Woesearchaeota archaeon]|nr:MAG: hypothetical protein DRJ17_04900 [Candidatus Woesearchaeota archaeon]
MNQSRNLTQYDTNNCGEIQNTTFTEYRNVLYCDYIVDLDGDGYDNTVDCDDNNASIYPGATELDDDVDQNCINDAPEIRSFIPTSNPEILETQSQVFIVTASDTDGDSLSYEWFIDDVSSGIGNTYTFIGSNTNIGVHTVKVVVTDGSLQAYKEWNLTVVQLSEYHFDWTAGALVTLHSQEDKFGDPGDYRYSQMIGQFNYTQLGIIGPNENVFIDAGENVRFYSERGLYFFRFDEPIVTVAYLKSTTMHPSLMDYMYGAYDSSTHYVDINTDGYYMFTNGWCSDGKIDEKCDGEASYGYPYEVILNWYKPKTGNGVIMDDGTGNWNYIAKWDNILHPATVKARYLLSNHGVLDRAARITFASGDGAITIKTCDKDETASDSEVENCLPGSGPYIWAKVYDEADRPILNWIEDIVVYEGDTVVINPTAYDPNGNTLTFTYSGDMNGNKWITEKGDEGNYTVTVKVSDGTYTDSQTINIEVRSILERDNHRPDVENYSPSKNYQIYRGQDVTFSAEFDDPDGDELTLYWFLDNTLVRQISGDKDSFTIRNIQRETYVKVTASDGELNASIVWHIYFYSEPTENHPPVLNYIPDIVVNEGDLIEINPVAHDPDGDSLTYYYTGDMMTNTWQTDYNDAGKYNVTVHVTDGELEDSQQISITINDVVPNRAPVITQVSPDQSTVQVVKGRHEFSALVYDPDKDPIKYRWYLDGELQGESNSITINFQNTGSYSVRLDVTDPYGLKTSQTWIVNVIDSGKPDLIVAETGATVNTPKANHKFSIKIIIKNIGDADADDVYWTFKDDLGTTYTSQRPIKVKAHHKKTVHYIHSYSNPGTYAYTITVDKENKVAELSENNNELSGSVTIIN